MRIAIAIVSIAEIADGRACKHDFNLDCKMNTPSVVPIILLYFVFGATSIYSIRLWFRALFRRVLLWKYDSLAMCWNNS